jgi:hypothetical protein
MLAWSAFGMACPRRKRSHRRFGASTFGAGQFGTGREGRGLCFKLLGELDKRVAHRIARNLRGETATLRGLLKQASC